MNNRGSALLLVLGVIVTITIFGASYASRIINESTIARKNIYATQAFWIGEAGIQKAVWDYDHNQCLGMKNAGTNTSCTSCLLCGLGLRTYTGALGNGGYVVTCDPDTKTYVSIGTVWQGSGPNYKMLGKRKIQVFFGRDYIFGFAAFSPGNMVINNNSHVDSYNSNNGAYNPASPGFKGNMGTNGGFVDVIDIGNNTVIRGSVSTGPGGTVDYTPSKVSITGGVTHTNDIYIEPVTVPSLFSTVTYSGTLNVAGVTTLPAGNYWYDKITLGNAGTLNITGNVKIRLTDPTTGMTSGNNTVAFNLAAGASVAIYTDGAVNLGNKVTINASGANPKPSDFQIYSRYAGANGVIIDNNNVFYGTVYAPLTEVEVSNNGEFFGSIVGNEVTVSNNGMLHYDESLASLQAPWQPAEPRDWQEKFD